MLLSLPADILPQIIYSPRACACISMCSRETYKIFHPMITWIVDGAPGRIISCHFKNVTADICGRIYSITSSVRGHISVEFNGRRAQTVDAAVDTTPTELSVHFPVVGDISLAEAVREILGADRERSFCTRYIKRLHSISGPGIHEIRRVPVPLTFTFEPIRGVTIIDDEVTPFAIYTDERKIRVTIGGKRVEFVRFRDPAIHWLQPFVIGGVALYSTSDPGDTKIPEHAGVLLTLYFQVLTSDEN
jgi:hypothetical protein